ncbi:hypothetical protein IU11_10905 [Cellulosimicrobium sp. MM]|nr:hypothetical protein IU11_10905 [Cellulosimicrobium sp. MM]
MDRDAERLDQPGVVGRGDGLVVRAVRRCRVRAGQELALEPLRGLDGAQRAPVDRLDDGLRAGRVFPRPRAPTRLIVSVTGSPGTTAPWPARTAATTRRTSDGGARGRAASWTSTTSAGTSPSERSRPARRPAATEAWRVPAPSTTRTGRSTAGSSARSVATWSRSPGGAVTTSASTTPDAHSRRAACATSGRPSSSTRALGRSSPRRVPEPRR